MAASDPPLFFLSANAPVASADQIARFESELGSVATVPNTRATSIMASQVDQKVVSVDGTILASEDRRMGEKNSAVITMHLVVERVLMDDADGCPAEDLVTFENAPFPSLMTTKALQAPDKQLIAMPRIIDLDAKDGTVATKLVPLTYINASYFKKATDEETLSAASVPVGTRVRLTGVTSKLAATKKNTGFACVNFKKFNVLDLCDNPTDAPARISKAMQKPSFLAWQALEAAQMVGGLKHMVAESPLVGSDLAQMSTEYRKGVAACLEKKTVDLQDCKVGVGEKYESEFCSAGNRAVLSTRVIELLNGECVDSFTSISVVHDNGTTRIPFHHRVRSPASSHPSVMKELCHMSSDVKMVVVPHVVQVDVDKTFVKFYAALGYAVPGKRGQQALEASVRPIYGDNPFSANFGIKMSLKALAVTFATRSMRKATMLCKELMPFADFIVSAPAYPREAKESVFSDDAGGLNWSDLFTLNMPLTLSKTSLLLTCEYIKSRFGGGEANIESNEVDVGDMIPLPDKMSPPVPSLRRFGYASCSEGGTFSTVRNSKADRLPPGCDTLEFRCVFVGVTEAIKNDPKLATDTNAAEKYLDDVFKVKPDAPEESSSELLKQTVLYAVASVSVKQQKHPRDDAANGDAVSGDEGAANTVPTPVPKKLKKK